MDREIIAPNPGPQTEFCKSTLFDVGYGGGKKGGKALTPDHEVLTDKGWVPIGDIQEGDTVVGLKLEHPRDQGGLVYTRVAGKFEQDHDGDILTNKYRPYFRASPDHRWLVSAVGKMGQDRPWRYENSPYLTGKGVRRIAAGGRPVSLGGNRWSDAEMELWGWYIAEGCRVKSMPGWSLFSQTNADGRQRLVELAQETGNWHRAWERGIAIEWEPPLDCGSDCYSKFIPRECMAQSNLWHLVYGFHLGDGEKRKRPGYVLATASEQLADDLQEAGILCGYRATKTPKKTNYKNSDRAVKRGKGRVKNAQNWRVHLRPRRYWNLSSRYTEWERYEGKTYCLSVPETGNFMVRHRGSAYITGNSFALLLLVLYYISFPNFRALIVRRESSDLAYLWDEACKLYKKACPDVKMHQTLKRAIFPSGAWVWFGQAKNARDAEDYQGHKYQLVGIDEATQWPNDTVLQTLARELLAEIDHKTGRPWMHTMLRTTANPIGPGVAWYKKRYQLDKFPKGGVFFDAATKTHRQFIHSVAADNPQIDFETYTAGLRGTSRALQKALIDGDFNSPEGAAFEEFDYDRHVIAKFKVPKNWEIYRSGDWGFATWTVVHWWAFNPDNKAVVCIGELSLTRTHPSRAAQLVLEHERNQGWKVEDAVMDPAAWTKEGTSMMSPAWQMIEAGCDWRPAHNDRQLGFSAVMTRLVTDVETNTGELVPSIRFVESACPRLIETLPILPKEEGIDDVCKKDCKQGEGIDHWFDSCRYECAALELPELAGVDKPEPRWSHDEPVEKDYVPYRHARGY